MQQTVSENEFWDVEVRVAETEGNIDTRFLIMQRISRYSTHYLTLPLAVIQVF